MEFGLLVSFLGASVVLSVMPGPDNIFVLTESVTKGHRNGIAISFGLCIGIMVHTVAAATGLSIIVQQSAMAFSVVKFFGAAYMFYLAYKATKEQNPQLNLNPSFAEDKSVSFLRLVRKGFLMNVLNPKVALFFIAFLPQFTTPGGLNVTLQLIVLGLIFMLQALVVFSAIAVLSGKLTPYVGKPGFWRITKWGKIGVLSSLGLFLACSEK